MAFDSNKDVEEYFQLLSEVRQEQSISITDELCAFADLLSGKLKQGELGAVRQGLDRFKIIFGLLRPILDKKDLKFERDHRELMALAAKFDIPLSSALIRKDISHLDPSGK